jgi:predicted nucleic acid-binding protein
LILLSDANVLIDLGYVDGLSVLTQLGTVEVLDVVFDECCHPRQPELPEAILRWRGSANTAAGIQTVTVTQKWALLARSYQTGPLSFQDALCLYYAKTYQRVLLTNEKPLRRSCQEQQVPVHGTLWIIQSVYERQLLDAASLCEWLSILRHHNRRLPKAEVSTLQQLIGC